LDWKKDRIKSALDGTNPTVLSRMKSGFAVICDTQFLPGYCILLGYPKVGSINDLSFKLRSEFLTDMTIIGDAVLSVCKPLRINYDILGNTDAFCHAHIYPRYEWEDDQRKKKPIWLYPQEFWTDVKYLYDDVKHLDMKNKLSFEINKLKQSCYRSDIL
jgi:diadenosine tetraphosphate (Ap4A) HIT family hydrolase